MKNNKTISKMLFLSVFIVVYFIFNIPLTFGQVYETEPNDPCTSAEDLGAVTFPFVINGGLSYPDVDFFEFTGTPGEVVRVDLEGSSTGMGTLSDPFLGFFNSSCTKVAYDDDGGVSVNSRLEFTVPSDGIYILAASSCCDYDFTGGGSGTYQMTISHLAVIGSIKGQITNAVTGETLSGNSQPYTYVRLYYCENSSCYSVASQSPDSEGRFSFSTDYSGHSLYAGTYQISTSADEYLEGQTEQFAVAEDEDLDIGNITLEPYPIGFSEIRPCGDLPHEGGRCLYSVRVNNRQSTSIDGKVWSLVESYGTGSLMNYSSFQAVPVKTVRLGYGESKVVQFSFDVPETIRDGTYICAEVFFGQDRRAPFFNTVEQKNLFCISKGSNRGFSLVPDEERRNIFNRLNEHKLRPEPSLKK